MFQLARYIYVTIHVEKKGLSTEVEIMVGHWSISERFFFLNDRTLFHVFSKHDRPRAHGCATSLLQWSLFDFFVRASVFLSSVVS